MSDKECIYREDAINIKRKYDGYMSRDVAYAFWRELATLPAAPVREVVTKAAIRANRERRETGARAKKLDTVKAAELYALGWSDARIAAKLKAAGPWRIRDWRKRTGRPANNIGRPHKKGENAT